MATYEPYELKSGKTKWHARGYLGTDEATGLQVEYNKRGFDTKTAAQRAYTYAKNNFYDNPTVRKKNEALTYQDVYEEWLEQYKKDVAESTLNKTKTNFRLHILPKFGNMRISKIDPSHLQKAINGWHDEFAKYKTVYNYTIRVLDFAFKRRYIKENPKEYVNIPKPKRKLKKDDEKKFYSREELKQFMEAISKENMPIWHTFYRLLAYTGLRRGEALALTWDDVTFNKEAESHVTVNKTLTLGEGNQLIIQPPKNDESYRDITIDPVTEKILRQWKTQQAEILLGFGFNAMNKEQLLFSKLKDNTHLNLSTPRNRLVNITDRNNLPYINVHGFRHTHTSLLFEAGFSVEEVMERLGHSDIQTTMNIYTHVSSDRKKKSAGRFADFIQNG